MVGILQAMTFLIYGKVPRSENELRHFEGKNQGLTLDFALLKSIKTKYH